MVSTIYCLFKEKTRSFNLKWHLIYYDTEILLLFANLFSHKSVKKGKA